MNNVAYRIRETTVLFDLKQKSRSSISEVSAQSYTNEIIWWCGSTTLFLTIMRLVWRSSLQIFSIMTKINLLLKIMNNLFVLLCRIGNFNGMDAECFFFQNFNFTGGSLAKYGRNRNIPNHYQYACQVINTRTNSIYFSTYITICIWRS